MRENGISQGGRNPLGDIDCTPHLGNVHLYIAVLEHGVLLCVRLGGIPDLVVQPAFGPEVAVYCASLSL